LNLKILSALEPEILIPHNSLHNPLTLHNHPMTENLRKEQFSIAYLKALAAVAGVSVVRYDVDIDGVDVLLCRDGGRSPHLSLQLKCSQNIQVSQPTIAFPLKLKNYNDLCRQTLVPRLLAVLRVPPDIANWVVEDPDSLLLHHGMYWLNLLGQPELPYSDPAEAQTRSKTVHIPTANLLSSAQLNRIMDNIDSIDAV
jgi:hypothetical protein